MSVWDSHCSLVFARLAWDRLEGCSDVGVKHRELDLHIRDGRIWFPFRCKMVESRHGESVDLGKDISNTK